VSKHSKEEKDLTKFPVREVVTTTSVVSMWDQAEGKWVDQSRRVDVTEVRKAKGSKD
jgi:hypothetical protein